MIKIAEYKEYRIAVDNNVVNLEQVGVGGSDPQITQPQTQQTQTPLAPKDSTSKVIAIQMGKQAATYAASNYANLTGDTIGQTQINEGFQLLGMGLMLAKGGVIGAVAVGTQLAVQGVNRYVEVSKSRTAAKNIQLRRGMNERGSR